MKRENCTGGESTRKFSSSPSFHPREARTGLAEGKQATRELKALLSTPIFWNLGSCGSFNTFLMYTNRVLIAKSPLAGVVAATFSSSSCNTSTAAFTPSMPIGTLNEPPYFQAKRSKRNRSFSSLKRQGGGPSKTTIRNLRELSALKDELVSQNLSEPQIHEELEKHFALQKWLRLLMEMKQTENESIRFFAQRLLSFASKGGRVSKEESIMNHIPPANWRSREILANNPMSPVRSQTPTYPLLPYAMA